MRYFTRLASGLDVAPARAEIVASGGGKPYRPDAKEQALRARQGMGEANPPGTQIIGSRSFPQYPKLLALLDKACGFLPRDEFVWKARVKILPPRSAMLPHCDDLPAAERRYQVAIQCDEHAFFDIDGERCRFNPGDMWRVDVGDRPHHVDNGSERARIVLVFDTLPEALAAEAARRAKSARPER